MDIEGIAQVLLDGKDGEGGIVGQAEEESEEQQIESLGKEGTDTHDNILNSFG